MKEKYTTANKHDQILILTIFAACMSTRKLMQEFKCSQRIAVKAKQLEKDLGILSSPSPKAGKKLDIEVTESVKIFYRNDNISRQLPGKKDYVSVKENGEKKRVQKRLVLCNLRESYSKFKTDYPDAKIGFSKFASLRPKECVLAGACGTHSVCVCTIVG